MYKSSNLVVPRSSNLVVYPSQLLRYLDAYTRGILSLAHEHPFLLPSQPHNNKTNKTSRSIKKKKKLPGALLHVVRHVSLLIT